MQILFKCLFCFRKQYETESYNRIKNSEFVIITTKNLEEFALGRKAKRSTIKLITAVLTCAVTADD